MDTHTSQLNVNKYRKKPVVIEAIKWNGFNTKEVVEFCPTSTVTDLEPGEGILIPTLEGIMLVGINDFVIKGVQGEFYPCKSDIFDTTYEKVETDEEAS